MKTVSLKLPDELAEFFQGAENDQLEQLIVKLLQKELAFKKAGGASELVRIITRTKARVCNWEDLEREILKGSIG